MRKRLTNAIAAGAGPGYLWDADLAGFGLRVRPSGARSFVLKTFSAGRQQMHTIGPFARPWTCETARREALRLLHEVRTGGDPAAAKRAAREAPTVGEWCDRYIAERIPTKKLPTQQSNLSAIERHIRPRLGSVKLAAVTRADVARLHHALAATPTMANRTVALLSAMFSWAERLGELPDGSNPCRHVEHFKERRRERYLSTPEIARLGQALASAEHVWHPSAVAAIRLLLLTGCRKNEILKLRWEDVDLDARVLRLPDSKTGPKIVRLGAPAVAVLAGLSRELGNPHVLPGRSSGSHYVQLHRAWLCIARAAGLEGVRIHDLRHSFASIAASGGESLLIVGGLLGHRHARTTERYAHLSADPVHEAADRTASTIAAALAGSEPPRPAVPFRRR